MPFEPNDNPLQIPSQSAETGQPVSVLFDGFPGYCSPEPDEYGPRAREPVHLDENPICLSGDVCDANSPPFQRGTSTATQIQPITHASLLSARVSGDVELLRNFCDTVGRPCAAALPLITGALRVICDKPKVYAMPGRLEDLRFVYGDDISEHVREMIEEAKAYICEPASLHEGAAKIVTALRSMGAHTEDQLFWLSAYADTCQETERRRLCNIFGLDNHFEDFRRAAISIGRPDLASTAYYSYRDLPVTEEYTPYCLPAAGCSKGSAQYWQYCVENSWPRKCRLCAVGKVYPRGLVTDVHLPCDFCVSIRSKALLSGFGRRKAQVTPQSMQACVDMFTNLLNVAASFAANAATATASALKAVFDALVAPFRSMAQKLWKVLSDGIKNSASNVIFGILCTIFVVECARRGVCITLAAVEMLLRILVCSGCVVLDMMLSFWQKVRGMARKSKRKNMYERSRVTPESDEGPVVKLLACMLMATGPAIAGFSSANMIKALSASRGILAGLTLGADAGYVIMSYLPTALREYSAHVFGFGAITDDKEESAFLTEAFGLLKSLKADKAYIQDLQVASAVERLHSDACSLIAARSGRNRRNLTILESVRRSLAGYCATAHRVLNATVERPEPVMLYMESDPGCGKSYCAAALSRCLAGELPPSRAMYTHSRTAYQTGYSGQFLYHIDELGATQGPEEQAIFSSLLKMVSVAQEEMPMASVEDKGTMFTSPFILVTTNRKVSASDCGLKYPDAFYRRLIHCKVTIDPRYANAEGQISSDTINAMLESGELSKEDAAHAPWMRFKLTRVVTENGRVQHKSVGVDGYEGEMNLQQLVVFLKAKIQEKHKVFEHRVQTLKLLSESCLDRAAAEECLKNIPPEAVFNETLRELPPEGEEKAARSDVEQEAEESAVEEDEGGAEGLDPEFVCQIEELLSGDGLVPPEEFGGKAQQDSQVSPQMDLFAEQSMEQAASPPTRALSSSPLRDRRGLGSRKRHAANKRARTLSPACNGEAVLELSREFDRRRRIDLDAELDSASCVRDATVIEALRATGIHIVDKAQIAKERMYAGREASIAFASELWAREDKTSVGRAVFSVLLGGAASMFVIRAIFKLVFGASAEDEDPPGVANPEQLYRSRVPKQRRPLTRVYNPATQPVRVVAQAAPGAKQAIEALSALGMEHCVAQTIAKNFGRIVTPSGTTGGWFAYGSRFCAPAHVMRTNGTATGFFPEGQEFSIECAGIIRYLRFKASNLSVMENGASKHYVDWISYDCERVFPTKGDLTKYFCTEQEHRELHDKRAYLVSPSEIVDTASVVRSDSALDPYHVHAGTSVLLTDRYQYKANTRAGDCGMLLVAFQEGRAACIYGSHVAKVDLDESWAAAIPMTKEWVRKLTWHKDVKPSYEIGGVELDEDGYSAKVPEGRIYEGRIPQNMRRQPNVKTAYVRSAISNADFLAGDLLQWSLPVLGDSRDVRCSMAQCMLVARRKEKYELASAVPFDPRYVDTALAFMLTKVPSGGLGRALTWEEVLNGVEHVSAMPRGTSCGWPLKLFQQESGKRGLIEHDGQRWHFLQEALDSLQALDLAAREGRPLKCVMQIIPKDEILATKKTQAQDIRTVTIPPYEVNVLFKKYFGAYAGAIHAMAKRASHPIFIGADFYSSSWDHLIRGLEGVGATGFDGDHGGFEYNHDSDVVAAFLAHVEAYYAQFEVDEGDSEARRVLGELMIHTRQLNQDVVFECSGEFASGLWITNIFNSCASWFYVLVGFFALLDQGGRQLVLKSDAFEGGTDWLVDGDVSPALCKREFDLEFCGRNLGVSATGDDHIVAVSETASLFFSGSKFARFMHDHNRRYTPADKAASFGPDRPIRELGFLSGETIAPECSPIPGIKYYYALKVANARRQLIYVSKDAGASGLADNCRSYLLSQWARGRGFYNAERRLIQSACDEVGYAVDLPTYEAEFRRRVPVQPQSLTSAVRVACKQAGRGLTTVHDSEDARRFLAAMRLEIADAGKSYLLKPISKIKRSHGINYEEMQKAYERADTLVGEGLHDRCLDKLVSSGGFAFVEHEGDCYAYDGNNRVAALHLAVAAARIDGDPCFYIPVVATSRRNAEVIAHACRTGGCRYCSFDDCDCATYLGCVDRKSCATVTPQMEAAVSVHEGTPPIQPTAGSDRTPDPMMAFEEADVVNILKREALCALCIAPPSQYSISWSSMASLCGLLGKDDLISFTKPAPHCWWMRCYSLYTGSTRLTTHFKADHSVAGSVDLLSPEQLQDCLYGSNGGLLPAEYTNEEVGFTSVQLPSLTPYGAVAIPHDYDDLQRPESHNGFFGLYVEPAQATGKIFTSVGDDATLSGLWQVPTLVAHRPAKAARSVAAYDANEVSTFRRKWLDRARESYQDNPMMRARRMLEAEGERKSAHGVDFVDTKYGPVPFLKKVIPQMEGGKGIVFDETAVVKQPVVVANPAAPTCGIPEASYSYVDMMKRSQHVGNIKWGVSAVESTVLYQQVAPWDYFLGACSIAAARFRYFRGDLVLRFSVQSSVTQSGMLMVVAVPLKSRLDVMKELAKSWASLSVNNHCFLRAGCNSVVEMRVPYSNPSTMLDTERGNQLPMCSIIIVPVNALLIGENAPESVEISIFSSFENCSLAVIKSPQVTPQGAGLSSLSRNVADVVTKTVDVVGSVGQLVGQVQDRPNVGLNPTPVVRRAFPYTSNSTNVDYRHVLALRPGSTTSLSPQVSATTQNETKISYLTGMWTMFDSASFTVATNSGEMVLKGPISPVQLAYTAADAEEVRESLLGYVSLFHSYWTGPIELRFEFVATTFHTFRVVFCTHYGESAVAGDIIDATQQNMISYNYSFDKPSFAVVLPWRVARSVLRVASSADSIIGVHSEGEWSLRLDTAVVAPTTVTDTVRVNLYIKGGDGFRLHGAYEGSSQYTPI